MATKLGAIAAKTKAAFDKFELLAEGHKEAQIAGINEDQVSKEESLTTSSATKRQELATARSLRASSVTGRGGKREVREAELAALLGVSGDLKGASVIGLVEFANREDASAETFHSAAEEKAEEQLDDYKVLVGTSADFVL